jgi:hypothetical protein
LHRRKKSKTKVAVAAAVHLLMKQWLLYVLGHQRPDSAVKLWLAE